MGSASPAQRIDPFSHERLFLLQRGHTHSYLLLALLPSIYPDQLKALFNVDVR